MKPKNFQNRKTQRRKEAEERQLAYNKLSVAEKMAKLGEHRAEKQRARLASVVVEPAPKKRKKG